MKRMMVISLLGLAVAAAPLASATAGVAEMAEKCEACHGKDGNSDHEKVPNIAGMSAVYLHDAMMAYLSGDRPARKFKPEKGEETDMKEVVKKISEDEVNAIAEYYAGKTFMPHKQQVDTAKADLGAKVFDRDCEKCHSNAGTSAEDDAAILAGQWKHYLVEQFDLFTDGTRIAPKKMAKKWEKLKDNERDALVEFLASGPK